MLYIQSTTLVLDVGNDIGSIISRMRGPKAEGARNAVAGGKREQNEVVLFNAGHNFTNMGKSFVFRSSAPTLIAG